MPKIIPKSPQNIHMTKIVSQKMTKKSAFVDFKTHFQRQKIQINGCFWANIQNNPQKLVNFGENSYNFPISYQKSPKTAIIAQKVGMAHATYQVSG